ncbi:hypothetical protein [Novosphingobium humi]|uniref:Concanavalin A-like lectin/glucanases superfamily protein n=1 Tax=Novosphingobium humi TaxID=2282397 RepID=A0ABY7U040_9SPHN|nr:hypothetical protein [Novosphingobium humi]WCT78681.1 hypothetical protein PQ457_06875 [Novosphingobium humi]
MVSVIQRLSSAFTDTTLPKLYRDPIMNAGTLALFDFLNAYCNPNPDGALASGATFNNLVEGSAIGATLNASGNVSNLTGKAGLSLSGAAGGTAKLLTFGAAGAFDDAVLKHHFLYTLWLKTPAASPASGYTPLLSLSPSGAGNGNNAQMWSDTGSDGYTVRFQQGTGSSTTNSQRAATANNAVAQVGYRMNPGNGEYELFYNGASVTGTLTGGPTSPLSAAAMTLAIGGGYKGTIYRVGIEDLTVSGLTAAAQVAADYAANSARFV